MKNTMTYSEWDRITKESYEKGDGSAESFRQIALAKGYSPKVIKKAEDTFSNFTPMQPKSVSA